MGLFFHSCVEIFLDCITDSVYSRPVYHAGRPLSTLRAYPKTLLRTRISDLEANGELHREGRFRYPLGNRNDK